MKVKLKKGLSLLLAIVMLTAMLPTMTSAEAELTFGGTQANISKITSGALNLTQLSLYKGSGQK